jgi:hypothetical protein
MSDGVFIQLVVFNPMVIQIDNPDLPEVCLYGLCN